MINNLDYTLKESTLQHRLSQLLSQPESLRDPIWEEQVLNCLPNALVHVLSPEPQAGPDGWPYLFIEIKESHCEHKFMDLIHDLVKKGIGLVINPHKYSPDFIFTFGMIWYYQLHGHFKSEPHMINTQRQKDQQKTMQIPQKFTSSTTKMENSNEEMTQDFIISTQSTAQLFSPSLEYWPTEARKSLKNFLNQQGIFSPEVVMVQIDSHSPEFCFTLESFGHPPKENHQGILTALSWFFPSHYYLSLIDKQSLISISHQRIDPQSPFLVLT